MHKKFRKIYLEITNCCNLQCSFCPGTVRERKMMEEEEFSDLMPKLRPWTDYLYFHLMGEPLLHPKLDRFLAIAGEYGFRVILTTNGTLLEKRQEILLNAPALHKVNISLHSFEANDAGVSMEHYLNACFSYGIAASGKKITVYRLWNRGGIDSQNSEILKKMKLSFPEEWIEQPRGTCLADKVFLEYGDKFDWLSLNAEKSSGKSFCYGLRDQIGILCDGTVVPCCLDSDGNIPLGNLHNTDLNEIIYSQKAMEIYHGFSHGKAAQDLCRRCGYARRFH